MNYKLVLVGEAPGAESTRGHPERNLLGSSGANLCRIAEWDWDQYIRQTERMNLFLDPMEHWNVRAAAASASEMLPLFRGRRVILLGAKVARAFGLDFFPHYTWTDMDPERPDWASVAVIPHPSGRNRKWNDAFEMDAAYDFLHELLQ